MAGIGFVNRRADDGRTAESRLANARAQGRITRVDDTRAIDPGTFESRGNNTVQGNAGGNTSGAITVIPGA